LHPLADSFLFLTLTRLVVVFIFVNFSFALFTPLPLGDYQCVREELKNGSPDCSVYARRRAAKVRRGRSWLSGEVLSGPRARKASQANGEANRAAGAAWKQLGWAGHGGRGSGANGGRKRARRS
jgi:hypothetical protein